MVARDLVPLVFYASGTGSHIHSYPVEPRPSPPGDGAYCSFQHRPAGGFDLAFYPDEIVELKREGPSSSNRQKKTTNLPGYTIAATLIPAWRLRYNFRGDMVRLFSHCL